MIIMIIMIINIIKIIIIIICIGILRKKKREKKITKIKFLLWREKYIDAQTMHILNEKKRKEKIMIFQ